MQEPLRQRVRLMSKRSCKSIMDNRNLYGFAFFVLIVKATVLLNYAFFTPKPTYNVPPPPQVSVTSYKSSCSSFKKIAPKRLEQASLDLQVGKFGADMNLTKYGINRDEAVTLDFYVKDAAKPRLVGSERVDVVSTYYEYADGKSTLYSLLSKNCSRSWVRKLNENQSVYVMVRTSAMPEFNDADAQPVLLLAGR